MLSEVFVFIIPQVIQIHFSKWEVFPRTPREMRIFVLIISLVIRIYFGKWEVVVALLLNLTGNWLLLQYKKEIL